MKRTMKETVLGYLGPVLIFLAAVLWLQVATAVKGHAADLGGNCCADLEERIAELEATTAKKGNRKVSLTVTGVVAQDYAILDTKGYHQDGIISDGNIGNTVAIAGAARVSKDLTVGYKLEIELDQLGLLNAPIGGNEIKTRQSYWWIKSDAIGAVSVGKQGQATQDFDKISTNLSWLVNKPLSFGVVSNWQLSGFDLPFDGDYRSVVKYTSPDILNGFKFAATYGTANDTNGKSAPIWDVALTYGGEPVKGLKTTGAVGYRHDVDLPLDLLGITTVNIPAERNTFLANASFLYVPVGVFVNVNYGNTSFDNKVAPLDTLQGYEVTAGLDQKWFEVGHTELFGTWGTDTLSYTVAGWHDTKLPYWGLGAVQSLDGAATDLFVGYRRYLADKDGLNDDVSVFEAGARVQF